MIDANKFSIGSEHELFIYDSGSLAGPDQIARLIARLSSLGMEVKGEFFEHQIEYCSPVYFDIPDWIGHLKQAYADIFSEASALGLTAAPIPICEVGAGRRRLGEYAATVSQFPWHHDYPAICGIHVHLGFGQDKAAQQLFHNLAWAAPHLVAQITSEEGVERLRLGRAFPRHGFPGTQHLGQHIEAVRGEPINNRRHWFDYMWNPRVETIEVRFIGGDVRTDQLAWLAGECLVLANTPISDTAEIDCDIYERRLWSALYNISPSAVRDA